MADKTYRSSLFKRIIDLGLVREAEVNDLVRIWRVGTGDEKAITLQNFVNTVDADLGSGGFTLSEIVAIIEAEVADTDNEVQVIYVDPASLSGTGTIEEQICAYINANVAINYSKLYSKLNIVLGVNIFTVTYGILYNWFAVSDVRNIANTGWKAPQQSDFTSLVTYLDPAYLGGSPDYTNNIAGTKMKEVGIAYWRSPNSSATNSSAFNLRGNGERGSSGAFGSINDAGGLFTSEETGIGSSFAWGGAAFHSFDGFSTASYTPNKKDGLGVRLLKETTTLLHGETGTYTGNDGKTYRTICIGTQEWLADNLSETLYRNSDPIPDITDGTTWSGLTTGARCFYNNVESNGYPA
jgi:uncharacterized protein (TIGR02145 family)